MQSGVGVQRNRSVGFDIGVRGRQLEPLDLSNLTRTAIAQIEKTIQRRTGWRLDAGLGPVARGHAGSGKRQY